jgi:hypothetical protein
MPVKGLLDHPDFERLPAAGRGMVISIVLYYWKCQCQPLPTKPSELFIVARAFPPTWKQHKATILRIFNDIKDELDAYHKQRSERKSLIQSVQSSMVARKRAGKMQKNAPARSEIFDAAPARERERYERVATPEERGPRARVVQTMRTR